uniref:Aladin-like n=1 Tax=Nicotiana tabacum TaxID=4097 RepID=A0A1S4B6A3_TOBAC|nr:PREDICTED: aladin-like [Nicotiana tabacum]
MPSFPRPGSVTVCEINRDLITAEELSDDGAKETYGKVLGIVFSPVPFQSENLSSALSPEQGAIDGLNQRKSGLLWAALQTVSTGSHFFRPIDVNIHFLIPCQIKKEIIHFLITMKQFPVAFTTHSYKSFSMS